MHEFLNRNTQHCLQSEDHKQNAHQMPSAARSLEEKLFFGKITSAYVRPIHGLLIEFS